MNEKGYIEKILLKKPEILTIDDLQNFFSTEQEEGSVLEFKTGQVDINKIFKEVAAFLNTEGGLIIIGSPREAKRKIKKHEITFCKGKLTYSKFKGKDF